MIRLTASGIRFFEDVVESRVVEELVRDPYEGLLAWDEIVNDMDKFAYELHWMTSDSQHRPSVTEL